MFSLLVGGVAYFVNCLLCEIAQFTIPDGALSFLLEPLQSPALGSPVISWLAGPISGGHWPFTGFGTIWLPNRCLPGIDHDFPL